VDINCEICCWTNKGNA